MQQAVLNQRFTNIHILEDILQELETDDLKLQVTFSGPTATDLPNLDKEPFTPIQAIKICKPKNKGTFRKIFAGYRRGNPNGNPPLFVQLKDGTYKAIRPFKK